MSDSNSESVVESDSEGEGQEKIYKKIKTSSLLDEPNKDRFMGLILKLINKLIFFEDSGYAIAKIFLNLSYFDPLKFYPVFFEALDRTMADDHKMTYITIKNCFLLQINPLIFNHKNGI